MLFPGIVFAISTIILIWLVQEPMSLLKESQPDEYDRIGGSTAPVFSWKALSFTIYLALAEFRKNVRSSEIANKFGPAVWVARVQLASLFILLALLLFG